MDNSEKTINSELDEAFEQSLQQAVRMKERADLLAYLKTQDSSKESGQIIDLPGKSGTGFPLKQILAYAASICLLAVLGFLLLRPGMNTNTGKLAEQYYKPYPNIYKPITRSQNPGINNEMLALAAYEAERYDLAYELFSRLEERNDFIDLFWAISSWEIDKKEEAKVMMTKLVESNSEVKRTASWYSAIFALGEDDKEAAKSILLQMSNSSNGKGDFSKEAREILETLK